MEVLSTSTKETEKLAQTLANKVKPGMVIALFGELGSGKTTFVSFLVQALSFESRVQSPTFVIYRKYTRKTSSKIDLNVSNTPTNEPNLSGIAPTNSKDSKQEINQTNNCFGQSKPSVDGESSQINTIHHIDFYRLTTKEEVLDFGLPEILLESNSLFLIEWPDIAVDFLPNDSVKIYFTIVDETIRKIVIEGLE